MGVAFAAEAGAADAEGVMRTGRTEAEAAADAEVAERG